MENQGSTDSRLFRKSVFYPGKLLHASDLTREQEYHNRKLEFINRKFLGWGIIEGLEVQAGRGGSLYLSKGSAIDPSGKILVVPEDRRIETDEIDGIRQKSWHDFILGIRFAEHTERTESGVSGKETNLHSSIMVESYALKAYEEPAYLKLSEDIVRHRNILTEEKILYQDGTVTLALQIP